MLATNSFFYNNLIHGFGIIVLNLFLKREREEIYKALYFISFSPYVLIRNNSSESLKKYLTEHYFNDKAKEFHDLRLGWMSVDELIKKFIHIL